MAGGDREPREFLLVSWDGGGNVPPMLALVKRLCARGHRVRLLGTDTLGTRARRAGSAFEPFTGARSWTPAPDRAIEDDVAGFAVHLAGPELATELVAAVGRGRPDVLVVDAMAAGALSAAEHLGSWCTSATATWPRRTVRRHGRRRSTS